MSFVDLIFGWSAHASRLPRHIEDLRGPSSGVIMLPRGLSLPGLRECDIGDEGLRRSVYRLILAQGKRNDVVRYVNAGYLRQDWPVISKSLDPRLRRWCEHRFALARRRRG